MTFVKVDKLYNQSEIFFPKSASAIQSLCQDDCVLNGHIILTSLLKAWNSFLFSLWIHYSQVLSKHPKYL